MILTAGLLFFTMIIGSIVVDMGLYLRQQQALQNAADAASLAAVQAFFESSASSTSGKETDAVTAANTMAQANGFSVAQGDLSFGYVDPVTTTYDSTVFNTASSNPVFASTGGYDAVLVNVSAGQNKTNSQIPSIFANVFGVSGFSSSAQSVAVYRGGANGVSGLRPFYMCVGAWNEAQSDYGDPTIPEITFYGSTLEVNGTSVTGANNCGAMGPGNWGFADFGEGNGAPALANVIANGWSQEVDAGSNEGVTPGNKINSCQVGDAIQQLISNQTVITVPLYDTSSGNGNNATFHIVGFAGFQVDGYQSHGNNSYIQGHFKKTACVTGCNYTGTSTISGTTSFKLVH